MSRAKQAARKTETLPPQTPVEIRRGVSTRRTQGGIQVTRFHYSAHPERDPETYPEWKAAERRLYTSEAS